MLIFFARGAFMPCHAPGARDAAPQSTRARESQSAAHAQARDHAIFAAAAAAAADAALRCAAAELIRRALPMPLSPLFATVAITPDFPLMPPFATLAAFLRA